MKHNRIISIFLIFAVFLASFSVFTVPETKAAITEEVSDYYSNRLGLLSALGVVSELGTAQEDMSEEEFVKAVLTLIGYDEYFSSQDKSAKEFAQEQGFYGNDDVKSIITVEDAYVIVLNALGYKLMAESYGGNKNAYRRIAMNEDLSDNVKKADSFTNENAVTILYNALFMNFFDSVGAGDFSKVRGTVLKNTFGCYEAEGLVTGVYLQSLSGNSPKNKDEIVIDNITYKTNMDEFYSFFGKYVKFYYTNHDGNELLYAWHDNSSYVTIDASMVTRIKKSGKSYIIEHEGMKGEHYKESVIPKYASLNGEIIDYNNNNIEKLLDFYTGSITLTDTDKDEKFDCIILEKYQNYLVSMVTDKALYDANGLEPLYLDNEEDDKNLKYWYDVYINGKRGNLSSAAENDVVSVYRNSKGNIIKMVVSSKKTLIGTVDSVVKDERGTKLIIDGLPYYSPPQNKVPSSGASGVFYLDSQDVVAGFELKDIYHFAYLIDAASVSMGKMQMKLCLEGETGAKILDCARKISVKVGAEKAVKRSAQDTLDILNSKDIYMPGLIKYRTDADGNVISILLPEDMSEHPLEADPTVFTFMGQAAGEVNLGNSKMGRFAVNTENTVAFSVPTGDNITDELYSGQLKLEDGAAYSMPMYYNTDAFLTAGAVVVFEKTYSDGLIFPTEELKTDQIAFSVIKRIRKIGDQSTDGFSVEFTFVSDNGEFKGYAPYNKNGLVYLENMVQRKYDENGNRRPDGGGSIVDYPVIYDTTQLFDEGYDKLNVGDLVLVRVNEDNRIDGMKRLWSNVRNQLMDSDVVDTAGYLDGHKVSAPDADYTKNNWYVFGELVNRNKSVMVIDATNYESNPSLPHEATHESFRQLGSQLSYGGVCVFPAPQETDSIYVLDRANGNEVTKGTIDDLRAGDEVVFSLKYGKFKGVLVIK